MKLERYGHGGDLLTAQEAYGRPAEEWLDFSSNMNPWGPPDVVGQIMQEHWRDIARYPDPAVRKLREKLAQTYQVPAESILVGNGAAELIDLVVRVLQPSETVLARPSFSEYEEAVRKTGGRICDVILSPDSRFELISTETLLQRSGNEDSRWFFLGHPNNPTGRLIPHAVLDQLQASGARMILDEAFMDFVPDESKVSWISKAAATEHIVVIRSMTKFYAIPGIRLGFVVAHPALIQKLRNIQTHWSVNFLAQLIGEAVLDEKEYAAHTKSWLQAERPWLMERLQSLGLRVLPGNVNFLLLALPDYYSGDVRKLQQAIAERGIMIRDASLFQGLDASYFRIAIRLRVENERLLQCLEECLQ